MNEEDNSNIRIEGLMPLAHTILAEIDLIYDNLQIATELEKFDHSFIELFEKMWDDEKTNGETEEKTYTEMEVSGTNERLKTQLQCLKISLAYCIQAMKYYLDEKDKHYEDTSYFIDAETAWSYIAASRFWQGIVVGSLVIDDGINGRNISRYAAALAKRRHAENDALAEDALKYWRENIDPTISAAKAANELVRVVPLSHKRLAEVIAREKSKKP